LKYKAIVFDLDGTLINSLDDLADSMNWALERNGLPTHPVEDYKLKIGNGVTMLAKRSIPKDRQGFVGDVLKLMRDHYSKHALVKTHVYAGLAKVIEQIKAAGCKLGVLTNKDQVFATVIVEHFFGKGYFDIVWGAAPGRAIKPDPAALVELLRVLAVEPHEAVFIGDSGVDMEVAKAAGCDSVGVLWGFRTREELQEHGARQIIEQPSQLLPLLG
jgi:phosphoglycolate phosphatase